MFIWWKKTTMNITFTILATLAIAAGVLGTLTLATMLLAGGANSSPEQIRQIKLLLLATAVGGLTCMGVGILLVFKSHPLWGGIVGAVPMGIVFTGIVWLTVSQVF